MFSDLRQDYFQMTLMCLINTYCEMLVLANIGKCVCEYYSGQTLNFLDTVTPSLLNIEDCNVPANL